MKALLKGYSTTLVGLIAMLMAIFVASCGGGDGGTSSGTLSVSLTDAPACGFDAVNVTVNKVRVHQSATASENDAGWTDIPLNPARKINLLNLTNGTLEELGQVPLAAGHYSQLRLVLDANTGSSPFANSVVLSGTTMEIALNTPSGVQSGIKLINEFDVSAGQRVDLVLDFDACKSVVTRGNGSYSLMPVITVIPTTLNGIDGFVSTSLLGSNVVVSAQSNGTVIRSTVPNAQTGEFFLARLAVGNYDVAITADNHATAAITGVPVPSATTITIISTAGNPITLPSSATHTISGTVTLTPSSSTTVANMAARQTFGSTPITVKTQAADLLSGAYALTLPIAAPQFGSYGTGTLPITFAAQTALAGKYDLQATASGYATQNVTGVNISAGDATQNFTLVP